MPCCLPEQQLYKQIILTHSIDLDFTAMLYKWRLSEHT